MVFSELTVWFSNDESAEDTDDAIEACTGLTETWLTAVIVVLTDAEELPVADGTVVVVVDELLDKPLPVEVGADPFVANCDV